MIAHDRSDNFSKIVCYLYVYCVGTIIYRFTLVIQMCETNVWYFSINIHIWFLALHFRGYRMWLSAALLWSAGIWQGTYFPTYPLFETWQPYALRAELWTRARYFYVDDSWSSGNRWTRFSILPAGEKE